MKIFVDCVNENCGKEFDILSAKWCDHLKECELCGSLTGHRTKVCPHCGECACSALAPFDSTEYEIVKLDPSIQGISYLIVKKVLCGG